MIMNRATPGPSMRRGTFEEGGRTKEEGDVICGVWSEECGVRIPLRFRNHDVTMTDGIKPLASPKVLTFGKTQINLVFRSLIRTFAALYY